MALDRPVHDVDVRPRGVPAALGFDLPELNLRTYVTRRDDDTDTPGVYRRFEASASGLDPEAVHFFSLDADGILGVCGARLFHHFPCFLADISIESDDTGGVAYTSRRTHPGTRPADFDATYRPTMTPQPAGLGTQEGPIDAGPGTLAEFLTERYRYYTETPGGELRVARIEHPRWPLAPAAVDVRENRLFEANGFPTPVTEGPHYYSSGVNVTASGSDGVD